MVVNWAKKIDKNIKIHLILSRVYPYFIPIIRRVIFLVQIQTIICGKDAERQGKTEVQKEYP